MSSKQPSLISRSLSSTECFKPDDSRPQDFNRLRRFGGAFLLEPCFCKANLCNHAYRLSGMLFKSAPPSDCFMRSHMQHFCLSVLLVLLASKSLFAQETAATPQNILLIMCDDLNCALGCYGDAHTLSPNIDKLAQQGVLFKNAYCQFPLCGPSRNSLLTGLYPDSNGILENSQVFRQTVPNQLSVPQHLRLASNYWTVRVGKMYHYNVPRSIGTSGHDDPESWSGLSTQQA